jgi:hypothetical protein
MKSLSKEEKIAAIGVTGIALIALGLGFFWAWQGGMIAAGICLFVSAVILSAPDKKP